MNKWVGISLGGILGLSHLGMIGVIATRSNMPKLNIPVNEYTSYSAKVTKEGYEIEYKAHDPKTTQRIREVKEKAGFLGLGNNEERIIERVPVERRPYYEPLAQLDDQRSAECIKAVGGGEQKGRMVGASVGAASASPVVSIGTTSLAGASPLAGGSDVVTTGDGALKGIASAVCRLVGGALKGTSSVLLGRDQALRDEPSALPEVESAADWSRAHMSHTPSWKGWLRWL